MGRCLTCNSESLSDRNFCGACGEGMHLYCPRCGFKNSRKDSYCGGCRQRLEGLAEWLGGTVQEKEEDQVSEEQYETTEETEEEVPEEAWEDKPLESFPFTQEELDQLMEKSK